ncbi:hypothetical protein RH915_10850 [Serpentinicella sp. ANB-PHB4]|uniref:hypothetical protein n=1 Tax=Serpentinicella sp. ANB-PHB4 TaxID=3074076 RepID=UPI0028607135|nr:hypothetical protein [Serpentinicella sp. ANB-PHB4]MDR5659987.1 hypothetical protein [Serpentinicella sp. ANB-PHB4]
MKKIIVIGLMLLAITFPFLRGCYDRVTIPEKVLVVGAQTEEFSISTEREIRDQNKVAQYESLLEEIDFESSEWEPETYPDFVLMINYKEGYFVGFHHIWIEEQGGYLLLNGSNENFTELTAQQVQKLKEITEE